MTMRCRALSCFTLLLALVCLMPHDILAHKEVSNAEARELLASPPDGLIILDIRTPDEFRAGHIPAAVNLDFFSPRFELKLAELPKNTPILLYCRSGNRSAQSLEYFEAAGLGPVYHLTRGFRQWQADGLPVDVPEAPDAADKAGRGATP